MLGDHILASLSTGQGRDIFFWPRLLHLFFGMEGDVPMSQQMDDVEEIHDECCPNCEENPCGCEEDEQEEPLPRQMARTGGFPSTASGFQTPGKRPLYAGKRPRAPSPPRAHFQNAGDVPDLFEYFAEFDLSPMEVVGVCRTFANYLCAQEKALQKEKPKKKSWTSRVY